MQKLTKNLFLVGSFLSWDGSKLRLLYTHRFICCFCFGVFFCKHTPSMLSSCYVVCGTIPSTCLKWNSLNTLIFVINKDLSFFYICHHANIKGKKSRVSVCLCQEILIHFPIRELSKVVFIASTIRSYSFSWWISCCKITSRWRNEMRFKEFLCATHRNNKLALLLNNHHWYCLDGGTSTHLVQLLDLRGTS